MSRPVILCVDDERIILNSLKAQLLNNLSSNYHIELAESAEEALEIVNDLREQDIEIPVVIADQIMTGMKGDELLSNIKQLLPHTLTIMLTGQATADAVGKAVNKAGLFRYLSKPWDEDDLILTVQSALDTWTQQKKLSRQIEYQNVLHQLLLLAMKPGDFAGQIREALDKLVSIPCFASLAKAAIYFKSESHLFAAHMGPAKAGLDQHAEQCSDESWHFRLLAASRPAGTETSEDAFVQTICLNPLQLAPQVSQFRSRTSLLTDPPDSKQAVQTFPKGIYYQCPILADNSYAGLLVVYVSNKHIHTEQVESFLSSFCHTLSSMFRLSASNFALCQSNLELEAHQKVLEDQVKRRTNELHQSMQALEEKNQLLLQANKELAYHATTDALTGLANRRSFFELTNKHLARESIPVTPACILLLDLDYFKMINDERGHQAGDCVLQTIASVIKATLEVAHLTGRVGGEEFAVFMPHTSLDQAVLFCKRLLEAVASTQIQLESDSISITGSIGLSEVKPKEHSIDKAIYRAYQALYASKHRGHNTLCIFEKLSAASGNEAC